MGKWVFTASNGSVVAKMTPDTDEIKPKTFTFRELSLTNALGKLRFFESGLFKFSALFTRIGDIGGDTPTDIDNAETLLLALIPSASGASAYDRVGVFDNPADLPITFAPNTIHSISILCLTGTLTLTVGTEETVLSAGQNMDIEATGLIVQEISIDSTTGTFTITTLD